MATPEQFARNIRSLALQVEIGSNDLKKKVALVALQVVSSATPVDTGRARGDWQVGLGTPVTSSRNGIISAAAVVSEGKAKINGAQPEVSIFISNNVDYIRRLNEGSSAQAPAGFIEQSVALAEATVRGGRVLRR